MKSKDIEYLMNAKNEYEAKIMADLAGIEFDEKQYDSFSKLEKWQKTIEIYRLNCEERGVKCII